MSPSGGNPMDEWLSKDMFDDIPEGVPPLAKEDDDEEEPTDDET